MEMGGRSSAMTISAGMKSRFNQQPMLLRPVALGEGVDNRLGALGNIRPFPYVQYVLTLCDIIVPDRRVGRALLRRSSSNPVRGWALRVQCGLAIKSREL